MNKENKKEYQTGAKRSNKLLQKQDIKRTNYRSWKAGKTWLYSASVLAVLAGSAPQSVEQIANSIAAATHSAGDASDKASAATASSGTLAPGVNFNAPNTAPVNIGSGGAGIGLNNSKYWSVLGNENQDYGAIITGPGAPGANRSSLPWLWMAGGVGQQGANGTYNGYNSPQNNQTIGVGYFNQAMDFSNAMKFNIPLRVMAANAGNPLGALAIGGSAPNPLGSSALTGLIITPTNNINTVINNSSSVGKNFKGVNGIPNSVFMGHDFYYPNTNGAPDGLGSKTPTNNSNPAAGLNWGYVNGVAFGNTYKVATSQAKVTIRATNGSGVLDADGTYSPKGNSIAGGPNAAPFAASDGGASTWGSNSTTHTYLQWNESVVWTPTAVNANGTVTGNMTVTFTPNQTSNEGQGGIRTSIDGGANSAWGQTPVPLTYNGLTLSKDGYIGTVGMNISDQYGFNVAQLDSNGGSQTTFNRATGNVTVNYIDKTSNTPMPGMSPTVITAAGADNVGNGTLGFYQPGMTAFPEDNTEYAYNVPAAPAGYDYNSIDNNNPNETVTVQDNGNTVVNVYYTKSAVDATFKYALDPSINSSWSSTLPALPADYTESGVPTTAVQDPYANTPAWAQVPAGYTVTKVLGPDGKTYSDLTSALAAWNAAGGYQSSGQNFIVYLTYSADINLVVTGDPTGVNNQNNTQTGNAGDQYGYTVPSTVVDGNGFTWNSVITITDDQGNVLYTSGDSKNAGTLAGWQYGNDTQHVTINVTYVMSDESDSDSASDSDSDHASDSDSDHASDSDSDHASDSDSDHASDSDSDHASDSDSDHASDSDSDHASDSDSDHASDSDSDHASDSDSDSASDSDSDSASDSDSDSASDSDSDSASDSDSDSASDSDSDSASDSDSDSASDSDSDSASDSDSDSASDSDSDSASDTDSDSASDSDSDSASDSDSDSASDSDSDSASDSDSDSASDSDSDSASDSDSISDSDSDSDSISDSDSDSDSISDSDSDSDSISDSDSDSDSASDSDSDSASDSDSDSASDSDSDSDSISDSDSDSTSDSDSDSDSISDSDSDSTSDSDSDSTSDSDSDSDSISDSDSDSTSDSDSDSTSDSDSDSDSESDEDSDNPDEDSANDGGNASTSAGSQGSLPDTGDNSADSEALLAGLGLIGLAGLAKRKKRKEESTKA